MDHGDRTAGNMALGRIFQLMSRPFQPGDIEEYERCRAAVLNVAPPGGADYRHCYVRDRLKGAAGD